MEATKLRNFVRSGQQDLKNGQVRTFPQYFQILNIIAEMPVSRLVSMAQNAPFSTQVIFQIISILQPRIPVFAWTWYRSQGMCPPQAVLIWPLPVLNGYASLSLTDPFSNPLLHL